MVLREMNVARAKRPDCRKYSRPVHGTTGAHPAAASAATILWGRLGGSVIPGGRRPQARIARDVGGWGMTLEEDE